MNEKAGKLLAGFLQKYANMKSTRNLLFEIIQNESALDYAPDIDRLIEEPGNVADIIHAYLLIQPQLLPERIRRAYDQCAPKPTVTRYESKQHSIAFGVLLGIFNALANIDLDYCAGMSEDDVAKFRHETLKNFENWLRCLITNPHPLIIDPKREAYYLAQNTEPYAMCAKRFFKDFNEQFEQNVKKAITQICQFDKDKFIENVGEFIAPKTTADARQPLLIDLIFRHMAYALLKDLPGRELMAAVCAHYEKRVKTETLTIT